jgi:hypothetical protein
MDQQNPSDTTNNRQDAMTSTTRNFLRPNPNFKMKIEHMTAKMKFIHKIMRKQPQTVEDETMNGIYEEEFIKYQLGQNPSLEFDKIPLPDAVQLMQEVSLEIMAWQVENWRSIENQQKAQSLLEGVFDVIFLCWNELGTANNATQIYLNQTAWYNINELDMLYKRLLHISCNLNLKSPLTIVNHRNSQQHSDVNNYTNMQAGNGLNYVPQNSTLPMNFTAQSNGPNNVPMNFPRNNGPNNVPQHAFSNIHNNGPNNVPQNVFSNMNNNGFNYIPNATTSTLNVPNQSNGPNYVPLQTTPSFMNMQPNITLNNGPNYVPQSTPAFMNAQQNVMPPNGLNYVPQNVPPVINLPNQSYGPNYAQQNASASMFNPNPHNRPNFRTCPTQPQGSSFIPATPNMIGSHNVPNNSGINHASNVQAGNTNHLGVDQNMDLDEEDDIDNQVHSVYNFGRQNFATPRNNNNRNNRHAGEGHRDAYRKFDDTELKIVNTIKSWPNKFDGQQGHFKIYVESWMARITEDITAQKILTNIEWLLEGEALKWHKIFGTNIHDWEEYVTKMQNFLNRGKNDVEIEADFNDGRHNQKKNEKFVTYYTRIKALSNKMKNPPSEARLFERIKRGLHNDYFFCKISATDTNDLMSKCAEYEATLPMSSRYETSVNHDPFAFLKDKQTKNIDEKFPFNNNSNNRTSFGNKPFTDRRQGQFHDYRNKFWSKNRFSSEKTNEKVVNVMAQNESDEESERPELTRGNPRDIEESDVEFLEMRETEILDLMQSMNMNAVEYKKYQERQKCQNCHEKGHTIDQCPIARRGIWFEHCKKCGTTNVTFNNCPKCTKNE